MNFPTIEQMKLGLKMMRSIQAAAWDEGANAKRNLAGELSETNPYRGKKDERMSNESCTENAADENWGACGIQGCTECLPLFDEANNPIAGTDV